MILCIVLPNEDLHPTDRWFEDYTDLARAVRKHPEDFEPNTKYVLITPSKTLTTHPQTRIAFDVVSGTLPGCEKTARKPRAKKEPHPVERSVGDGLGILPKLTDKTGLDKTG